MGRKRPAIAYYITPHGFGHAVRSLEILRRLTNVAPDIKAFIISDIPPSLVEQNIGKALPMRRVRLDVGLCQHDSIRFDLEETLRTLQRLQTDAAGILERETAFLREKQVRLVVSDVAFLPFDAAAACGIASIGISNFTWDWIYGAYAEDDSRWNGVISRIRGSYAKCGLFLRLPMHGDCSACPKVEDVPLVARKSSRARDEVRSALGLRGEEKAVLVAFGSLELSADALRKIEEVKGAAFYYKSPMTFPVAGARAIDGMDISYVDAVAAADAVITKPGYGIVSDCLANGTPIIYTERGLFPEYDVLVETIRRELTSVHIDSKDFFSGNWEGSIRQICSLPRRTPSIGIDGADVCANRILQLLE
ncbi:MAG: hypothetical protein WAW37_08170 [Syntrophobacteraceae bacterium]